MPLVLAFVQGHLTEILCLVGALAGVLVGALFPRLSRVDQDRLLAATKGAYLVLANVAPSTPITWDDALASLLKRVADEMGRQLKPLEVKRVKNIALALLADPAKPDLVKDLSEKRVTLVRAVSP